MTAFRALQTLHGLQPGSVKRGYRVVITGTEAERPIARTVMAHMRETSWP